LDEASDDEGGGDFAARESRAEERVGLVGDGAGGCRGVDEVQEHLLELLGERAIDGELFDGGGLGGGQVGLVLGFLCRASRVCQCLDRVLWVLELKLGAPTRQ
jgi:hypothetical protein